MLKVIHQGTAEIQYDQTLGVYPVTVTHQQAALVSAQSLMFSLCYCWCRKRSVTWRWKTRIWSGCCYARAAVDQLTIRSDLVVGIQCHFVKEDLPLSVRQTFVYHWPTPQALCVICHPQTFHWSTALQTLIHLVSTLANVVYSSVNHR